MFEKVCRIEKRFSSLIDHRISDPYLFRLNSRCFAGTLVHERRRDLAVAAANSQVGSRWCANVHLEFGFRQSFQGELVVRASAGVYTSQGWGGGGERGSGATAEGVSVGNFVLVLARNFGPPSCDPPHTSRAPLASPVPLNKLVRFNDSYFFLVTRLPSFAPTRRLRKVAVNLVPSFAPSLSLSISATRDHRDSGLTTVRLSPSSSTMQSAKAKVPANAEFIDTVKSALFLSNYSRNSC